MRLYTYFRSSAAFRVRIALHLKNMEWESLYIHLAQGAQKDASYMDKNPQGLVPVLETDEGVISQSLAIIEYLDEIEKTPPLLPNAPIERAQVRAMAQMIACDIHPINNLRILKYLKNELGHTQDEIDTWYRHWIIEGFTALEQHVQSHGSETNCFGNQITLADICLVPQMWNARRFNVDLSNFPRLYEIDAELQKHEAFDAAQPENQKDFQ